MEELLIQTLYDSQWIHSTRQNQNQNQTVLFGNMDPLNPEPLHTNTINKNLLFI